MMTSNTNAPLFANYLRRDTTRMKLPKFKLNLVRKKKR